MSYFKDRFAGGSHNLYLRSRLTDSIETALKLAEGTAAIELVDGKAEDIYFSQHFACLSCGISFEELAPR